MTGPTWMRAPIPELSQTHMDNARRRQDQLTKPRGALGMLEEAAIRLATIQQTDQPTLQRVHVTVFAADHGVARAGISAFPQSVTVEMVKNFLSGGAAISVMARHLGASLEVVDVGCATDPGPLPGLIQKRIGNGTADFRRAPAMDDMQLAEALKVGRKAVKRAVDNKAQLFIGGEMGIGNTTSATAIAAVLLGAAPESITGPGTGISVEALSNKVKVIEQAIDFHQTFLTTPLSVLRHLGGFEIAALTGAYVAAGQAGLPVVVDGFIATAAALVAVILRPDLKDWLFFSHRSAEPGQTTMLSALEVVPMLQLDMRLGEGTGAAAMVPLLRLACALHGEMATFAEAAVSSQVT